MPRTAETTSSPVSTLIPFPLCSLNGIWLLDIETWVWAPSPGSLQIPPRTSARGLGGVIWLHRAGASRSPRRDRAPLLTSRAHLAGCTRYMTAPGPTLLRPRGRQREEQGAGRWVFSCGQSAPVSPFPCGFTDFAC